MTISLQSVLIGTQWSENSCAYDSIISITQYGSLMPRNGPMYSMRWILTYLVLLLLALQIMWRVSLEAVHNRLRHRLQRLCVDDFRWGQFTSLSSILQETLTTQNQMIETWYTCSQDHPTCERQPHSNPIATFSCLLSAGNNLNNHHWWMDHKYSRTITLPM